MLNLACAFAGQGHDVDLVLMQAEGPYLAQVPPSIRVVDLGARRLLSGIPAAIAYLRQVRPAALISVSNSDLNVVAVLARLLAGVSTRLVLNVQTNLSQEFQKLSRGKVKRKLTPQLVRWFFPWADAIVPVSAGVAEDLVSAFGLPKERIQVIHNPIVTSALLERSTRPVDHPWFAPGEPPVVLGVGRLTQQKDFPTLIRAFALVKQSCPARLVILGEGEERPHLEALVRELGVGEDVALPGFADNPYAYMAGASAFVLSSVWEGLPTVLVEAMAVGTPVVSTDCPSGPIEILENGQYGPLVASGDVRGLADAIVNTLDRPPDTEMLRGRAAEFSAEASAVQYLNVLGL
jgi:glycosyltransferase involved in cell wall biosynthesis